MELRKGRPKRLDQGIFALYNSAKFDAPRGGRMELKDFKQKITFRNGVRHAPGIEIVDIYHK